MKKLEMAVVSDIHLGHSRNRAVEIIQNLYTAFPDTAETGELDLLVLAGDVFDHLLSLPNEDVPEIDLWIAYTLRLCKKHDIVLRVLEGTPSHDWKQSQRFVTINEAGQIGADLKYVKELSIEYLERFDLNILYVPDEWESTTEKTLSQVQELLHAKGLSQVDFAIMHGQFPHQLPPHIKAQKHDSDAYLKLVRHLIFVGHVHLYSQYDRIVAQGSFDRLGHGEEGPKGHVRAVVWDNGDYELRFIETVNAKRFVTVHCTDKTLEDTLADVAKVATGLPSGAFVRVEAQSEHPIFANMELLVRNHPLLTWSKKVNEEKEAAVELIEDDTVYVPITLTRDNLEGLLMERMVQATTTAGVLEAARDLLKEVL